MKLKEVRSRMQVRTKVYHSLQDRCGQQVWQGVTDQNSTEFYNEFYSIYNSIINEQGWNQLGNPVKYQTWEQVRKQNSDQVLSQWVEAFRNEI